MRHGGKKPFTLTHINIDGIVPISEFSINTTKFWTLCAKFVCQVDVTQIAIPFRAMLLKLTKNRSDKKKQRQQKPTLTKKKKNGENVFSFKNTHTEYINNMDERIISKITVIVTICSGRMIKWTVFLMKFNGCMLFSSNGSRSISSPHTDTPTHRHTRSNTHTHTFSHLYVQRTHFHFTSNRICVHKNDLCMCN